MQERVILVAVTGNEPFKAGQTENTSTLVRDALPSQIKRPGRPTIQILKYQRDIQNTYSFISQMAPELWAGDFERVYGYRGPEGREARIDLMFHLGQGRSFRFERTARRQGYAKPGTDGAFYPQSLIEAGGVWENVPDTLTTELDIDAAQKIVAQTHPDIDTTVSDDAGSFFCDLIFFSSLAYLFKNNEHRRVEFMHMPTHQSREDVELAAKVATALIAALVDQLPQSSRGNVDGPR